MIRFAMITALWAVSAVLMVAGQPGWGVTAFLAGWTAIPPHGGRHA